MARCIKALLMKQAWRICKWPGLLVSKVLRAKYIHGGNFLSTTPKVKDSYALKVNL